MILSPTPPNGNASVTPGRRESDTGDADAIAQAFRDQSGRAFRRVEARVLKDREATRAGVARGSAFGRPCAGDRCAVPGSAGGGRPDPRTAAEPGGVPDGGGVE